MGHSISALPSGPLTIRVVAGYRGRMSSDGWPSGTVTFLFTDVEASTERWRRDEAGMSAAMQEHDDTLRAAVTDAGGVVFKHTGDGVIAAFESPLAAVDAAVTAQGQLGLPVRMGVHTGEAELRDGDYFGTTLNRAARILDAGHGGQVLVSSATAGLVSGVELMELGIYTLKGLETPERIHQVGSTSFPELRVHRDVVGNLPAEMDTFIGREVEVVEVAELVGAHRIVTLIGVGGTGKTRLALRVAESVRWQFPDGCWLVDLAAVATEEAVPFAFARSLGVEAPEAGDVVEHVVRRVSRQRRLVVVDNCEHLLDASGDVIEQLIGSCPNVHVLATSREPVMVRGERLSAVPSLTSDDAFGLFLERAAAEAPGLEFDATQSDAARELCERLDRLPLAIELVASRLRVQTPVELLAAIDERLRLLVGGRRSRMERHQTMRGTLDWSYDLCSPLEQQVFDALSVFAASFDLADAVTVAAADSVSEGEVTDAVLRLVDRSLLAHAQGTDGRSRFRLLETMRARTAANTSGRPGPATRCADGTPTGSLPSAPGSPPPGTDSTQQPRKRACGPFCPTSQRRSTGESTNADWNATPVLCLACYHSQVRISTDLIERVWNAADAVNETEQLPVLVAVLGEQNGRYSTRQERGRDDDFTQRVLSEIRHGSWRVDAGPSMWPPHTGLVNATLTPTEAQEVRESLRDLDRWPLYQQFVAHDILPLPLARALGRVDDVLDDLDRLAAALGGPYALGRAQQTRGMVAAINRDSNGSIEHHQQALALLPPSYINAIQSHFTILLHSALAQRTIDADLIRAPWQRMRDIDIFIQAANGTYCTGVALVHLGHPTTAEPFFRWFNSLAARWPFGPRHGAHDSVREHLPQAADLIEAAEPEEVPIDQIIDAALDAADALDAANQAATP